MSTSHNLFIYGFPAYFLNSSIYRNCSYYLPYFFSWCSMYYMFVASVEIFHRIDCLNIHFNIVIRLVALSCIFHYDAFLFIASTSPLLFAYIWFYPKIICISVDTYDEYAICEKREHSFSDNVYPYQVSVRFSILKQIRNRYCKLFLFHVLTISILVTKLSTFSMLSSFDSSSNSWIFVIFWKRGFSFLESTGQAFQKFRHWKLNDMFF